MTLSGFTSVVGRRMVGTVALGASLLLGANVWAQAAPAGQAPAGQAPAAQPAAPTPPADPFKFSTDSAVMIYGIAQDKVPAFESMWAAIRTKLAASEKPDLKALGDSLTIMKVTSPLQAGQGQTYFFIADPASQTTSYSLVYLLYSAGLFSREEAETMFNSVGQPAITQLSAIPTAKLK
jgi:hypothetical protein